MSTYRFKLQALQYQCSKLLRWCLDLPNDEVDVTIADLTEHGVWFQGWMLPAEGASVRPFIRQSDSYHFFERAVNRDDVIKAVLGDSSSHHPERQCGFREQVIIEQGEWYFGAEVDGLPIDLMAAQVVGVFNVLHGKDGWLFLDNDTNRSVDQFTGKILLTEDVKSGWKHYFKNTALIAEQRKCPFALLIAPAKESVYSEKYPFVKADITAIDEVLGLLPPNYPLVYPVELLRRAAIRSFRITDTHWSPYGACVASCAVAEALGVGTKKLTQMFANDAYRLRKSGGDLGNKLFPRQAAEEAMLVGFSYRKFLCYDNGFENFGRILVLHHPGAIVQKVCLVFGSSSSYSMFDYLSRIFSEVIFIHTAGSIDESVIELIKPDYLIAQTNARFIVKAPETGYQLRNTLQEKLSQMPVDKRQAIYKASKSTSNASQLAYIKDLHEYLPTAAL